MLWRTGRVENARHPETLLDARVGTICGPEEWEGLPHERQQRLVRIVCASVIPRGNALGHDNPLSKQSLGPPSLDPKLWLWRTVISSAWKDSAEHINILECRALLLALRWRLRAKTSVGSRFLHLVDSAVVLAAMSKDRSASNNLYNVVHRLPFCRRRSSCGIGGALRSCELLGIKTLTRAFSLCYSCRRCWR